MPLWYSQHDEAPFRVPFQSNCGKVPSRVPFHLLKSDKVPSRVPYNWTKSGKMPSRKPLRWTKCNQPMTFCALVPHAIPQMLFLLFSPLPLNHPESAAASI